MTTIQDKSNEFVKKKKDKSNENYDPTIKYFVLFFSR
jgi:hypothetical protein